MPSETEQAIERVRNDGPLWLVDDVLELLAEHDRLKAELDRLTNDIQVMQMRHENAEKDVQHVSKQLARLTTLRPASEHDGNSKVLTWEDYGFPQARFVLTTVPRGDYWTPLPTPRLKEEAKS